MEKQNLILVIIKINKHEQDFFRKEFRKLYSKRSK